MTKRNFQLYPKNERLKQVMIALDIVNLTELAEKLGVAYTTVSNWNKRNEIARPKQLLSVFPQLNPNYLYTGQFPVLLTGSDTQTTHSADIIRDIMLSQNIKNVTNLAAVIDIPEREVKNWVKTKKISQYHYQILRKHFPHFFAQLEQSHSTAEEPMSEYGKKLIDESLLEVIKIQKEKIEALEKELTKKKTGTKK